MDDALVIGAQALRAGMDRLNATSQNLVNATTPGYRRSVVAARPFDSVLSATALQGGGIAPANLSYGVDDTPGAPMQTGKPLDLAIDGEGYFELTGSSGTGYARQGSFRLAADGRVVNEQGYALMGAGGAIVADGPDARVAADGEVTLRGRSIGQVKTVRLDRRQLIKGEDGLLRLVSGEASAMDGRPRLKVGHLEGSNVAVPREMIDLMQSLRAFEAVQRLMTSYDDQLGSAIQRLSEF